MLLNYHDGPGTARYNGDITAASYFTNRSDGSSATPQGSRFHRYVFSYDDLSRLTGGEYRYSDDNSNWNANAANAFDLSSVSFDNVGNITALTRKDESGNGAAFAYHYKNNNTNWLDWVENLRNQAAANYAYDGNGNLIQDASKDLVNITYDYRNLPTRIEFNLAEDLLLNIGSPITGVRLFRALNTITTQNDFIIESSGDVTMQAGSQITLTLGFHAQSGSDFHAEIDPNIGSQEGNSISYTYNQAGNRITKSTSDNVTLYYIRDINGRTVAVLDGNDSPLFYNIAGEGKLVPGSPDISYYYLTDHLGSIRVIIEDNGVVKSHTDYYPFGMQMKGRVASGLSNDFYKYNAKQLDDEYALNWHDYGWRQYDGEVGRWWKIDRFADKYPSLSPYQYAANNPINFIDINGDTLELIGDEEQRQQALESIRAGLPPEVADAIQIIEVNGRFFIDDRAINDAKDLSDSDEFLALRQIVNSPAMSQFGIVEGNAEITYYDKSLGQNVTITMDQYGLSGFTVTTDIANTVYDRTNIVTSNPGVNQSVINASLNLEDRVRYTAHELYGHIRPHILGRRASHYRVGDSFDQKIYEIERRAIENFRRRR